MKVKLLVSILFILGIVKSSKCQEINILKPTGKAVYNLVALPVAFEILKLPEGVTDVKCIISFIAYSNKNIDSGEYKIFDKNIKILKYDTIFNLDTIPTKPASLIRDTIYSCKIKIEIFNMADTTNKFEFKATKTSGLFSVMRFSSFIKNTSRFEEIRNLCLYQCGEKSIDIYRKENLAEISAQATSVSEHQEKIKKLNEEIKRMEEENEMVRIQYIESNFWADNSKAFSLFPVDDEIQAKIFYSDQDIMKTIQFLQNTNLSLNFNGNASLYSDIVTTYWGPFRISFGNLVSNNANSESIDTTGNDTTSTNSTTTQDDAIQKLIGGGGNVLASLLYPVIMVKSSTPSATNFPITRIKGFAYGKVCYDIPGVGTASGDSKNINGQLGVNIDGSFGNKDISVVANFKYNFIFGTRGFQDYLEIGNGTYGNTVNIFKVDLGLNISNKFIVGATGYFGSKYVNNNFTNPTVFFTVLP